MIYIVAQQGLGNRMRVIHSAYHLSEKIKRKVKLLWLKDKNLNCSYHALFEQIKTPYFEIIEDLNIWQRLLGLNKYPRNITGQLQKIYFDKVFTDPANKNLIINGYDFSEIKNYKNVLIRTCYPIYKTDKPFDLFKPTEHLEKKISTITAPFFHTIGIHVRRTDHVNAIMHSTDNLFYTSMDAEISKNKDCNFYLATDSEEVKKEFINRYNYRIITLTLDLNRNTASGIQDGVVDLYCLAKTKKIYGSFNSTYSVIASKIHGAPLIVIKNRTEDGDDNFLGVL